MSTITSLQEELIELNAKAQAATDDAKKHRTNAANYNANGYADKAESEIDEALACDQRSSQYLDNAGEIMSQIRHLEAQADDIESQVKDLLGQYVAITGTDLASYK